MPKRSMSLSRSQSDVATPKRKKSRGSRSVCSPTLSTASGRLTSLIDQFKDKNRESFALSLLNSKSILTDNTDIEEPRRKSWWKKLDENTQAVMEMLEKDKVTDPNILIEDLIDIEVLSQEKKNFTLDLPDSSDNESINSIVLPQRKLFNRKENQPPKNFEQIMGNRESLAKIHKANTTNIEETVNVGTRQLFQNVKRSKLTFPSALLQLSPNKTAADKTKENVVVEPKVRNIFGNRPNNKRKNMYAEFIVSESEDEIPDIQPKVFGFHKKIESRRISSISKGKDTSPTSSITTDIEMDDWKHLPSSTMVDNQLEDMVVGHTPVKRTRLSKLSEAKESEAGTNTLRTNTTGDKTKQSNKSTSSKNKSKSSPEIKDKTLDNSRTTRSMAKNASIREELHNTSRKQDTKTNKSQNKTTEEIELDDSLSTPKENNKQTTLNKSLKQNLSRTRNDTKATENGNEMESEKAINDETKVIRKSSIKNKSNNITNKSVNEEDIEINAKDSTNGQKIQNKSNKTGSNNVNTNEENDDDDHNFILQYEDDIDKDEAVVNISVLEKKCQKDDTNKSRSNKSLSKIQKQDITPVKPAESQQNEQNTADDDVDGMQENDHDGEIELNQESKHNDSNQIEKELNKNDEVNESEENQDNINKSNNEVNISQEIEDEHKLTNESQEIQNESEDEEGKASEEVEDVANASGVGEDENYISNNANASEASVEEANASEEYEGEANASEENEEEANASEEDDQEANASEDEVEANASEDEVEANAREEEANASYEDEGNKSQEVEVDVNESHEADVNQSEEIEGEENESHVNNDDSSDEENNEEIEDEEIQNESQEVVNESDVENEADVSEHDEDMDSHEADKAIATDAETSEGDDNDEMEVDDEQEPPENVEETAENPVEHNEIEPSDEVIEESPDVTHDTTGRNRKKDLNKSPEAILNNRTNQMDSFTANGRNTSARKTKSMIKNLNIRPSLAPPRDSIGFSDGTTNSSAEGSGWDSHRTTRKTLRQTFGKDFTPRKSLRALVMEKSAKRHTEHIDLHSETVKFPQANSTEFPENTTRNVEDVESDHEVSRRTRQTTLETYLQKIKQQNINLKLQMEESVRNSLKGPARDPLSLFKVPNKPAPRRPKPTQNKPKKQIKSIIPIDELPSEVIADMKYKPPKRFQPTNASWITKRLYKYLENKLEARYDYKARLRAEKLVETIYYFAKDLRRHNVAPVDAVDVLKHELARLDIVRTHFEFYEFFHEFMPREIRVKVVPDIVNNIPLPRHGVFSDIIRGMQG